MVVIIGHGVVLCSFIIPSQYGGNIQQPLNGLMVIFCGVTIQTM